MTIPRSLTRRAPLFAAAVAAALCLAACAQTASIVISLDSTTALLIRGGQTQIEITLTRQGGAVAAVDLQVAGTPANVVASFAPATLSGDNLSSTLTLSAEPDAANGDYALNVTASGTGLNAAAALELEVSGLTVTGKVISIMEMPWPGLGVESQGVSTLTNGLGEFTIADLSVPYDLVIWDSTEETVHVFQGLEADTLQLSPPFTSALSMVNRTASVSGTLSGGVIPVGADQLVAVCVEGVDGPALGCGWVSPGNSDYTFMVRWAGQLERQVRVHALQFEFGADSLPGDYLGYGTALANLGDAVPQVVDVVMGAAPASIDLTVNVAGPVDHAVGAVQLSSNLTMTVALPTTPSFTASMPVLPGATYTFVAVGTTGLSFAWESSVTEGEVSLLVPVAPLQLAPGDLATGVSHATDFSALGSWDGPLTFLWQPNGPGPSFSLTTMTSTVKIPDLSSHLAGYSLPDGADYRWFVLQHEGEKVEDATMLLAQADYLVSLTNIGGVPGSMDGSYLAQSPSREFTTAP